VLVFSDLAIARRGAVLAVGAFGAAATAAGAAWLGGRPDRRRSVWTVMPARTWLTTAPLVAVVRRADVGVLGCPHRCCAPARYRPASSSLLACSMTGGVSSASPAT
jgi:NADH-quinone oxidoreductase subunit N